MFARKNLLSTVDTAAHSPLIEIGRLAFHPWVLCAIWIIMMIIGLMVTMNYQWQPAISGPAPVQWPASINMPSFTIQPALLMFLHPHCPCSRASVEELGNLMAAQKEKVTTRVIFFDSSKFAKAASESALWKQAGAIPGVQLALDPDGALAREFGVNASGTVLLYDAAGRLLFSGGITAGRGHNGENAGLHDLLAALNGESDVRRTQPVFGCTIRESSKEQQCLLQ